jgi:hypothetical protein
MLSFRSEFPFLQFCLQRRQETVGLELSPFDLFQDLVRRVLGRVLSRAVLPDRPLDPGIFGLEEFPRPFPRIFGPSFKTWSYRAHPILSSEPIAYILET